MSLTRQLVIALAMFALAASALAHSAQETKAASSLAAQDLTLALISANNAYAAAAPSDRGQRLAELITIARSRHDALAAAIAADPAQILQVALPASLRASFPGEAAPFLEQDAQEDGVLEVYHVDNVDPAGDHYLYFLNTARGKLALYFAGHSPALLTGARVRVNGIRIDNALALNSGSGNVTTLAAAVLPSTLGAQKTLTILVNFTDNTTQPFTVASAQSTMFATVSNYWNEASYQQTTLTGDVAGWFTIPLSTTTCDYSSIASYAKQAAASAGYVLSNYTRFLYTFPGSSCSWWGLSYVGGNPSQSWVAAKYGFTLVVIGHELGHALGLYHSHSLDCGSVSIASSGCTASEYGDIFDMMGGGYATPHYNAFQKERLGWLNAGISPPLTTIAAQTGTVAYTIAPTEMARNTVSRALKIAKTTACNTTQQWYYVESRQAGGYDSFVAGNTNVLSGVLVHQVNEGDANSSYLLDMTPATDSWSDPALDAGLTFTDLSSGLTITPTSVGSSATTVNVGFPAASCTRATPTIALAPAGTQWTSAGATANYTVTVTNNDGCGCAASTFDISATVPVGWGSTNPRTGSISAGSTSSAALGITSPASAAAAFYPITGTAANTFAPTFTASASGMIAIVTSLGVSVATDKTSYAAPTKGNQTVYATITTGVMNGATPLSGATVSVQVKDPRGSLAMMAGTTNAAGAAVVSYAIKNKSPTGIYQATSTASIGTMSNMATTSFRVQ